MHKAKFVALGGLKYEHYTVTDGAVQVRLTINDPASITKDLLVSGYVKDSDVDKIKATLRSSLATRCGSFI